MAAPEATTIDVLMNLRLCSSNAGLVISHSFLHGFHKMGGLMRAPKIASERLAVELGQLFHRLIHILGHPVGFDVRCAIDLEQFLVLRAGCLGECILGHVQAVGLATSDHQQRLVDQLDLVGGVEAHQVQQTARGVFEGRVGVRMRLPVVLVTLAI